MPPVRVEGLQADHVAEVRDVPLGVQCEQLVRVMMHERKVGRELLEVRIALVEVGVVQLDLVGLDVEERGADGEVEGEGEDTIALEAPGEVHDAGDGERRVGRVDARDGPIVALLLFGRVAEVEVLDPARPAEGDAAGTSS